MICGKCGKKIADNAKFCPHCGSTVEYHAPQTVVQSGNSGQKAEKKSFVGGLICGVLVLLALVIGIFLGGKLFSKADDKAEAGTKEETVQNEEIVQDEETAQDEENAEETKPAEEPAHRLEGPGFESAEEAAIAYVEALKAGNVEAMISTFAVETYVDHYNLAAQYDRINAISFATTSQQFRPDDAYTRGVNLMRRIGMLADAFAWQYAVLTGADLDELSIPFVLKSSEYVDGEGFLDAFMDPDWVEKLSEIEIHKCYELLEFGCEIDEEAFETVNNSRITTYSCDEIKNMIVEFSYDGEDYYFATDAVLYGDAWYLADLGGLAGSWIGIAAYNHGITLQSEVG